jgi:squalene synthase HpnC
LAVAHYENFPVASWLVPARLRAPIEAVYGFARAADDVADEGDATADERLAELDGFLRALDEIEAGRRPEGPVFQRLADAVREFQLPIPLLRDLIDAFRQDVRKKRYATYAELLDYSRRSANPIGRLVLHIFSTGDRLFFSGDATGSTSEKKSLSPVEQSDAICSALQFINFWQDIALDWDKGRVYIPQEDLQRFGVGEDDIAAQRADERWRALMDFECARSRALLLSGAPLSARLPGRLGLEIRATIHGGATILDKIQAVSGDVFRKRPVLRPLDWLAILAKTVTGK